MPLPDILDYTLNNVYRIYCNEYNKENNRDPPEFRNKQTLHQLKRNARDWAANPNLILCSKKSIPNGQKIRDSTINGIYSEYCPFFDYPENDILYLNMIDKTKDAWGTERDAIYWASSNMYKHRQGCYGPFNSGLDTNIVGNSTINKIYSRYCPNFNNNLNVLNSSKRKTIDEIEQDAISYAYNPMYERDCYG